MKKRIVQLFGMGAAFVFLLGLVTPSLAVTVSLLSKDPKLTAPGALATDGTNLFVGNNNRIFVVPIGGGTPTALVSGAPFVQLSANGLTFFKEALYVTDQSADGAIFKVDLAPVPEPATLLLLGSGLAGLGAGGWWKRRRTDRALSAMPPFRQ